MDLLDAMVWGPSLGDLKTAVTTRVNGFAGGHHTSQAAARLRVSSLHHTLNVESHGKFATAQGIGEAVSTRCFAWLEESYKTIGSDPVDVFDSHMMQRQKDYKKKQLAKVGKCTGHLLRLPEELWLRAFPEKNLRHDRMPRADGCRLRGRGLYVRHTLHAKPASVVSWAKFGANGSNDGGSC